MADISFNIGVTWLDPKDWQEVDGYSLFSVIAWQSMSNLLRFNFSGVPGLLDSDLVLIQSSRNPDSGWFNVAVISKNTNQYLDTTGQTTIYLGLPRYYRVLVPRLKLKTSVLNLRGEIDRIAAEISRRHHIVLSRGRNGNLCYVFSRMSEGIRCPECWDDILQQRIEAECERCFNTGWDFGFYDPIPVYVSFSPSGTNIDIGIEGQSNSGAKVSAWTSNYPVLSTGDVIIEAKTTQAWGIDNVQYMAHQRHVTRQNINMTIIQSGDLKRNLVTKLSTNLGLVGVRR